MKAPKLPSFIRQNQHQRFEFRPRYYDERKERLAEIKRKYEASPEDREARRERIQFRREGSIGREWRGVKAHSSQRSNGRLVLIIIALFALAYYLLVGGAGSDIALFP